LPTPCIFASLPASGKEGRKEEISTSLKNPTSPLAIATPSFLEMMMKQQQQQLLLPLMFLVVVAAAAAVAADPRPQPQQLQVQHQKQQPQMRMRMSRSLLQPPKLDCPSSCSVRCSNNWNNEMCNEMCNVCCHKCGCVPPGTGQDTRHLCSCYDTMVNPHNPHKLKCP